MTQLTHPSSRSRLFKHRAASCKVTTSASYFTEKRPLMTQPWSRTADSSFSTTTTMRFLVALVLSLTPQLLHAAPRIVGGKAADPTRYPYFVSIEATVHGRGVFGCGGTLIHPDVVLTAAHCLFGGNEIYTATVNLTNTLDMNDTIVVRAASARVHPEYSNFYAFSNDVALLQLRSSIYDVDPVKLNNDSQLPQDGDVVTVFGLGYLAEFNETIDEVPRLSNLLQVVNLNKVPDDVCVAQYEKSPNLLTVRPAFQMCAARSGKDSCQGDSGGPLVLAGANSNGDVQVGIVSFGEGCANEEFSGVNTRISAYMDWINTGICDFATEANRPDDCPVSKAVTTGPTLALTVINTIVAAGLFLFAM